jgi:hypothetical protein
MEINKLIPRSLLISRSKLSKLITRRLAYSYCSTLAYMYCLLCSVRIAVRIVRIVIMLGLSSERYE